MVRSKATPLKSTERKRPAVPIGWKASRSWWLNRRVDAETGLPVDYKHWEEAESMDFSVQIDHDAMADMEAFVDAFVDQFMTQVLNRRRGCILALGHIEPDQLSCHTQSMSYAKLVEAVMGQPLSECRTTNGVLSSIDLMLRLIKLHRTERESLPTLAAAAGETLRAGRAAGVMAYCTVHMAMKVLQYLPPAVSVTQHEAVAALVSDASAEIRCLATHTLAYVHGHGLQPRQGSSLSRSAAVCSAHPPPRCTCVVVHFEVHPLLPCALLGVVCVVHAGAWAHRRWPNTTRRLS